MAKYTIELSEVVQPNSNVFVNGGSKVFNFDYEFYDPSKKDEFETKFLNHFRFREIGVETLEQFQHYLKCKCDETLPFYNMLFRTALIDYEKTINYNLVETYVREVNKNDSLTNNIKVDGTGSNDTTLNESLVKENTVDVTSDKELIVDNVNTGDNSTTIDGNTTTTTVSEVDSTVKHTEYITNTKDETYTENGTVDGTSSDTVHKRVIGSDTPSSLLSMTDIENDVYASKADLEDDTTSTVNSSGTYNEKNNNVVDTSSKNTSDEVQGSNNDTVTNIVNTTNHDIISEHLQGTTTDTTHDVRTENGSDITTNTTQNDVIFENETNTVQNNIGEENENYTRIMKGSYGVITEADMLKKHIELQQTLSTILKKFFDECNDLFMQIY